MAKNKPEDAAAKAEPMTAEEKVEVRARFMAKRRAELIAMGELPAHEADAPAGTGEPVEQPASEGATREAE